MNVALSNTKGITAVKCTHCGEHCQEQSLIFEEKAFCCSGCKMVYEILDENDLCRYYDIEKQPGISFKNSIQKTDFDYLNDPEILAQLIDFENKKIIKITLQIPSIHCTSCLWLLEQFYKLDSGVQQSQVNFLKKELSLTLSKKETSLSKVVGLLHKIGYAPEINLGSLEKKEADAVPKSFYLRLGVTGFVFGNVMLLSFPEYLGMQYVSNSHYLHWFGYLNLALGLPLVFYSGWDYLRSAWLGFRSWELNMDVPISLGILALFGRSVFEILTHTGGGYMDSLAGLLFFLLVGRWFQQKVFHNISFEKDYQSYFPIAATVVDEFKTSHQIPLKKLEKGMRVLLKNGELIPADGILQTDKTEIDYSFVTGESEPIHIKKGDLIYAGGRQLSGAIEMILTKTISQSYLIQLWNDPAFAKKKEVLGSDLGASALAKQVGKYFTIAILVIAFGTLAYWLPNDWGIAINAFSAVLIIACPCAIALSIPFTYGNVLRLLARKSFYLKNLSIIEQLQNITHIVFDKTGTLTQRAEQLTFSGEIDKQQRILIKSLAAQSGHPRSQQIHDFYENEKILPVQNFKEYFGKGISGRVGEHLIKIGSHKFFNQLKLEKGRTYVQIDDELIGNFSHQSTIRTGLPELIKNLKSKFNLSLLSGDHSDQAALMTTLFGESRQLHFNQSPQDKLNYIRQLQSEGNKIMMIGDGLNDSGALQEAAVGVVISEHNNNFTPAGDGVISADSFAQLNDLLAFAKKSKYIVYGSYLLALMYNVIGLSFAVRGALSPVIAAILMPLSSLTIVLFGLVGSWWLYWRNV